jgi:hypothetical protein
MNKDKIFEQIIPSSTEWLEYLKSNKKDLYDSLLIQHETLVLHQWWATSLEEFLNWKIKAIWKPIDSSYEALQSAISQDWEIYTWSVLLTDDRKIKGYDFVWRWIEINDKII